MSSVKLSEQAAAGIAAVSGQYFLPGDLLENIGIASSITQSGGGGVGGASAIPGGAPALATIQTIFDGYAILESGADADVKAQALRDRVALAVGDVLTGGAASAIYSVANKYFSKPLEMLRKLERKFNPAFRVINELFGSKDTWKTEGKKLNKLLDAGIFLPDELLGATRLERGRTREELIDPTVGLNFIGTKDDGTWVNNVFAQTRDKNALRAEDIWGYAAFFEKFGNEWLGEFNEDQRRAIAGAALELGTVKEHHGTIDISWTPELEKIVDLVRAGEMS